MDINMQNVKLVKPDGKNWVCIEEIVDGKTKYTKLLYDDGLDADRLSNLKKRFDALAKINDADSWECYKQEYKEWQNGMM